MAICPISEIEKDWCGHCRTTTDSTKALATGATITAKFGGLCSSCDDGFAADDSITYSSEAGGWCHTGCTYRPVDTSTPTEIDLS